MLCCPACFHTYDFRSPPTHRIGLFLDFRTSPSKRTQSFHLCTVSTVRSELARTGSVSPCNQDNLQETEYIRLFSLSTSLSSSPDVNVISRLKELHLANVRTCKKKSYWNKTFPSISIDGWRQHSRIATIWVVTGQSRIDSIADSVFVKIGWVGQILYQKPRFK